MKREIKFRAKPRLKSNGNLISGDLINYPSGKVIIKDNYFNEIEILPETIGQYSTKRDINDKLVCEGDIVTVWIKSLPYTKNNYEVIFDGNKFSLIDEKRNGDDFGVFTRNFNLHMDEYEIIGNIYDNT